MSEAPTRDRADELLAELAELDMALARKVHGQAMAAEDPESTAGMARAYQGVARSLRQTLALKAKLAGERERARREALAENPPPPPRPDHLAIFRRRETLSRAVARIVWNESEREDEEFGDWARDRCRRAFELVDDMTEAPGFLDEVLEDQIEEVCVRLGIDPQDKAARWTSLPPLPGEEDDAAVDDEGDLADTG